MEIDISQKVGLAMKYGFLCLLTTALLVAGAVWYYKQIHGELVVTDAEVAGQVVHVRTLASGRITELFVTDGDEVKAGDVVARIAVRVTPEQIRQLERNVALTERNLSELQTGVAVTQPVYDDGASLAAITQAAERLARMENLYAIGAVSARERDEAAAEYEATQAMANGSPSYQVVTRPASPEAIREAERQVRLAAAALATARQEVAATEVKAPVSGTVYLTDAAVDREIRAGEIIVDIGDDANLWIAAYVSPERREDLRLGAYASYRVEGRALSGSVLEVEEPRTEPATIPYNTEGVQPDNPHEGKNIVRISLPSPRDFFLRPGSRAVVRISLR
ncbi:MAG: HlyD family secretion protein [Schwartzia sp. (in: firmicutes)]